MHLFLFHFMFVLGRKTHFRIFLLEGKVVLCWKGQWISLSSNRGRVRRGYFFKGECWMSYLTSLFLPLASTSVVAEQLLLLFLWHQATFVVVTFRLAKGCNFAWGPPSLWNYTTLKLWKQPQIHWFFPLAGSCQYVFPFSQSVALYKICLSLKLIWPSAL